ncbi:MAG: hypothetical protein V1893_00220 [Candidatus Omnitrophota bacterium]
MMPRRKLLPYVFIIVLAGYLFVIYGPVKNFIRHKAERILTEALGAEVSLGRLTTNIFTTVKVENIKITNEHFGAMTIDTFGICYNPLVFFTKNISGYITDKKFDAKFSVKTEDPSQRILINFTVFVKSSRELKDFLKEKAASISDISISGDITLNGTAVCDKNRKINLSLRLNFQKAAVASKQTGIFIEGISGAIPFTTTEDEMKDMLSVDSIKIRDIAIANTKADLTSQKSLLNFNNISYNIFEAYGVGKGAFALEDFLLSFTSAVTSLDLEKLDKASTAFKTKTEGIVDLDIVFRSKLARVETLEVKAHSATGGKIKQEVILALLQYLPKEKQTTQLMNELLKNNEFVYTTLQGEFSKDQSGYRMHLVLDGAHLLEFTITIEEGALGTLLNLFN